MPVLANHIAGAGEPFFIPPELLQGFGRVMLDAIAGGIAQGFQQSRPGEHGNIMRFEAEKPRGLKHVQPRGEDLMAQELNLSFLNIHGDILLIQESAACISYTNRRHILIDVLDGA